ncbi:HD domain-containing phosphohydrolase [Vibrio intestinalis]|uniref:HD domain-containing phosphohydrolase n=1 Tax=Vibrio intestinalis TaxID=2933291 RepID=UPI0021A293C5|nr:HD domain-containing phosphohydrolase [Vibrio intestinalis]
MTQTSSSARKFSIRFTVGSMFIFATVLTATFAISLQYYFGRQMSEEHVLSKLTMASAEISEYIQQIEVNATSSARILRSVSVAAGHQFSEEDIRDIFVQVLSDNPLFYSLYYGNEFEDFYQIINLDSSPIVRERIMASEQDRWVIIKIWSERGERVRTTEYFTESFQRTRMTSESSNYYPTQRPWFASASESDVYKTEPYLFKHLKITGQTYSTRSNQAVIGVDIVLSSVSSKISSEALGIDENKGIEAFLFTQSGEVIASNQPQQAQIRIPRSEPMALSAKQQALIESLPPLKVSNQNAWGPYDFANAGEPQGYSIELLAVVSKMTGIKFEFVNGFNSQQLVKRFENGELDVIHSATSLTSGHTADRVRLYSASLGVSALAQHELPVSGLGLQPHKVAVVKGRGIEQLLHQLYPATNIVSVDSFEQASEALLSGEVRYVVDSYLTLAEMRGVSNSDAFSVGKLIDLETVPFYLFVQPQFAQVIPIIRDALQKVTPLQHKAMQSKWLDQNVSRGGFVPYADLYQMAQTRSQHNRVIQLEDKQQFFYVTPVSSSGSQEYFAVVIPSEVITHQVIARLMKSVGFTVLVMMVFLPVAWLFGSPIVRPVTRLREETLKIKQRRFKEVTGVKSRIKEVHELSVSMREMVQEIERHQQDREAFVEAFIRLIAQAIDDKSPYTAGHCNRVPELGMMLAKIAEDSNADKFKDFRFANDDERREFRIAAWLHDCGKITTPEHVVDKGTKLEANYNRIHEIRTRFEVLWRDAEIEYLRSVMQGEVDKAQAFETLHQKQAQLQQDFEFIANANVGGEFMSDDKVERIKHIASQTWMRHFDNRLGLSPCEELVRIPPQGPLPVEESLLADKPEHIIDRVRPMEFDPNHGIKMDVPEHQYNYGEIYNLSISRGTLTAEDRFKINEHMISGIKMLEALPFPPELSKVPRYASTHHETLDGKGYPRKLTAEQLSIPERILVIADVFEALTAADRPYKKAKPLSVAIDILSHMANDNHIDKDLFMLFLTSGGFKQYADKYLPPEQIDEVDITKYVHTAVSA